MFLKKSKKIREAGSEARITKAAEWHIQNIQQASTLKPPSRHVLSLFQEAEASVGSLTPVTYHK